MTYLKTRDQQWRELIGTRLDAEADPLRRALVPFDVLPEWLPRSSRGCSFVNAFAELPEPDHPGRQLIVAEKQWLRDLFRDLLTEAGTKHPEDLAVQLLSLHEGAIVSYSIADESSAASITRAAAEALVKQALN
ncbi:hypothetical protein AB0I53_38000 [Saccharopolyspora sp. NPDC050389]|uniref:hypothetical protein n=1 Tax=Saccharopolyspora sp. NPDC050389 TaxID=3155516 RepID=UPI0033DA8661